MLQLISLVVFVALMGFIFLGGTSYIPIDKFSELSIKTNIINNYQILKQGQMLYREHTDSYLSVPTWKTDIAHYTFIPKDSYDLTWEYNKNGLGYYFCLTGNVNDSIVYSSLVNIGDKMGANSYYVNETCGSSINFLIAPDLSTSPKVSATFFIK